MQCLYLCVGTLREWEHMPLSSAYPFSRYNHIIPIQLHLAPLLNLRTIWPLHKVPLVVFWPPPLVYGRVTIAFVQHFKPPLSDNLQSIDENLFATSWPWCQMHKVVAILDLAAILDFLENEYDLLICLAILDFFGYLEYFWTLLYWTLAVSVEVKYEVAAILDFGANEYNLLMSGRPFWIYRDLVFVFVNHSLLK